VERFDRNVEAYRSGSYNETQARREFIDPLFKALGWDIDNESGYAEAYKDVIHEDAIKVGGVTKAPDYCFRVGGTRKFFVEAKKPAVNIKNDVEPAFQLRRYAWSAKLPLSILTDFEEFAVYDCRVKPDKSDGAATGRTIYLPYTRYDDEWDTIAGTFSKEAVLQGSFDKYAETTKGKRGTAEVDAAFLKEIEEWRDLLARNLALRNSSMTQRELNYAVQTTIDRLIFLRICEDRGVEDYGGLQALLNGAGIYPRLLDLYTKADRRYNSGLFHFEQERGRSESPDTLTPGLTIDDKTLKDIIRRMYYPDSPYEFSVLPADILGQVYEQFLGKVIRLTAGHHAVVEDKPEVKKAGGVYYTPTYIVDYIVKNTVGVLLEGSTPKKASALRILDPACGSGSFLIGTYQYLLDWHRDWYIRDGPKKHVKELFTGPGCEWRLTTGEKKRILLNNICGVDIDSQAVETTKLSLLLKVLEGETAETINAQLSFLHERALPDLADNIKCGNSLIGPDFYDDQQLGMPLDEEDRYRINVFDWEAEFPGIFRKGIPEEKRGFDAVIGNPPYIRIQRVNHSEADYYYSTYRTLSSKTDLSQVFLEKSLTLLNVRGLAGFICTSQWMSTEYGRGMRRLLADGHLRAILHFGSLPVFAGVNTYPAVFIIGHAVTTPVELKCVRRPEQLTPEGVQHVALRTMRFPLPADEPWSLGGFDIRSALRDRGLKWMPMRDLARAQYGVITGLDSVFVVTADEVADEGLEEELILPYAYRGADVVAFAPYNPAPRIIYPYAEGPRGVPVLIAEQVLRSRYPRIYARLLMHKSELRARRESRKAYAAGDDWYRHARPGSFAYIHPPKLIAKGIATKATVGLLAGETAFSGANVPAIVPWNLRGQSLDYLLALLNSNVMTYHLRAVCPPKLGNYIRVSTSSLNEAPIPLPSDQSRADDVCHSAANVRQLKQRLMSCGIPSERQGLERQLRAALVRMNLLIYDLFLLTDDEVAAIEDSLQNDGHEAP